MGTHNLAATLIAGHGVVLTAALNATPPTWAQISAYVAAGANATSLPAGFTPIGETDPGDLPKWDTQGGDEKVKRTWRVDRARVVKDPSTKTFIVKPLQFDDENMSLYEGGGDAAVANQFTSPAVPVATERQALVIYLDGGSTVGEYMGRVSFSSGGSIEHNVDDWSKIPLKGTVLTPTVGSVPEHRWYGPNFGTP